VLPRRSRFSRKVAGETTEEQIVAANIDTVFIVMGLDGDYNPRRLERYLLMASESGARPVVLLNKSDVADHLAEDLDEIARSTAGIPVHAISARERSGIEVIQNYLGPGRTGALLGSSGVGKSTIVNALMGNDELKTRDVRASDSRGRHTTRHRHLILLGDRGLLIDTPGMRELQLWTQSESARETFEDVESLAAGCHFTDCQHREEPRCAVKLAIADGTLAAERLENYQKLQDEMRSLDVRKDARAQIDEKRKMKTIGQSLKKLYKSRDR
jgi:ribosome biogenesis GTPase